jgi:hypothetical protein
MTNTYRAITDTGVAMYADGVFDLDLNATEEQDALASKHIELVPRKYKVLSDNFAAGRQGETIEAAYLVDIEQALIQGGHLERVDDKPKKKAAAASDE